MAVVGLGPGGEHTLTIEAKNALQKAEIIIGYKTYIKLVKNFEFDTSDKKFLEFGMKKEIERAKKALNTASEGKKVAVVSSGDPGVYGMAGPILELSKHYNIDVEVIPGLTASNASASVLGAPLMHDYVTISLSDLLTPFDVIKNRVKKAAEGDFVITLYNPKSNQRQVQFQTIIELLLELKSHDTPVGIVKNCKRPNERAILTTLSQIPYDEVDMLSTVIIGNSQSYIELDKFITPRGYKI
ncbi:precorrin-3B C(17)-methyltransferase [Natranaerofaba carboxydovora]|uniref:precorrin-3B C(17)-methyltransferase n=1 Tax=Natranaerofaba carboxydovora TaxID=2742683 RepID=UPI003B84A3F7